MYELTCPACRQVMKTPFARLGAMATCAKCKHRFAVTNHTMRRLVPSPPSEPLVSTPADWPRPATPGELPAVAEGAELLPPASPPPARDARAAARRRARVRQDRQRRQRGPLVTLSILAILLAGGIGGGVWWYFRGHADASRTTSKTFVAGSSPLDPQTPLVQLEHVAANPWQGGVAELFTPSQHGGPVKLDNEKIVPDGEGAIFRADVVTGGNELLETATLHLALVDRSERVYARTQAALLVLSSRREQEVEVKLPRELYEQMDKIDWRIEPGPHLPGAALFERIWLNATEMGQRTALKVTAYNPLFKTMRRAFFVVSAYDEQGRLAGQWMLNWTQPIAARQRVEFGALTANRPADVARWEIAGGGVAAGSGDDSGRNAAVISGGGVTSGGRGAQADP